MKTYITSQKPKPAFIRTPRYPAVPRIMNQENKLEFYLVTSDHLTESIWFRNDQDFKVGMNYIAIISLTTGIKVLAFILMSNHVHLVLQCTREEAEWFFNELKRRYSEYLSRRYGTRDFLRLNDCVIQPVFIEDESLERAIAYTIMNSVAANICLTASDYPWSSASAYFKMTSSNGMRIGDMSERARRRVLHSRSLIPEDTVVGDCGYILPESFIPVKFVESIFRIPKRLNWFMFNSSKAKKRMAASENGIPSFRDQVILAALPDMCNSKFRKSSISELGAEEMSDLVKEVRRRFNSDAHQIARVIGLPYPEVSKMLESF